MQVITGKYRARKLVSVDGLSTRPTLARVKESIFNLISDKVAGSVALDLFAGSGAFGVECISRNVKEVYFVDREQNAIKAIETNTKNMKEDFKIIKNDYLLALQNFKKENLKFNLVFLDPPYKSGFLISSLQNLAQLGLLENGATIVAEHEFENDLLNLPDCYIIEKSRKYGIAFVDIITFKET
jgi:16S rRNA (guanine(966)-N(2))-methyltransferase RsmD